MPEAIFRALAGRRYEPIARGCEALSIDTFPDPPTLTVHQLVELIDDLADELRLLDNLANELAESAHLRGVTQRKIEILRAELGRRSDNTSDDPM